MGHKAIIQVRGPQSLFSYGIVSQLHVFFLFFECTFFCQMQEIIKKLASAPFSFPVTLLLAPRPT